MKLHREFKIYPGWDKRSNDPKKDYGIHGCELAFYVHDARKSRWVQFKLSTDWLPLNVQKERMGKDVIGQHPDVLQVVIGEQPNGIDLGYHSPKKMYKDQTKMECDLRGGYCYYDGSGLAADDIRNIMLEKGSDGVWEAVEAYWHEVFEPSQFNSNQVIKGE